MLDNLRNVDKLQPWDHPDNGADRYRLFTLAKLTKKTLATAPSPFAGLWLYDWQEQVFDPLTGIPQPANPRREGSYTAATDTPIAPALEANNRSVAVGTYVYLKQKGVVRGQVVYEFEVENQVMLVKITSLTKVGKYYPAIEQIWDPVLQVWVNGDTCYYLDANSVP